MKNYLSKYVKHFANKKNIQINRIELMVKKKIHHNQNNHGGETHSAVDSWLS